MGNRAAIPAVPPLPGSPPAFNMPGARRETLSCGLDVVLVPAGVLPQLSIRIGLLAGAAADPPGKAGAAAMTAAMLTEGTTSLSAGELNRRLDEAGASISASASHDFAIVDVDLLAETAGEILPLAAGVLLEPAFPLAEFERVRAETLDGFLARQDEPANLADDTLARLVFGPEHPYGRLAEGTAGEVAALDRDDLVLMHQTRYGSSGSFLIAAGLFDPDWLLDLFEQLLRGWGPAAGPPGYPPPDPPAAVSSDPLRLRWPGASQAEIRVGGLGITRDSADWIPAGVMNYILGGSTITGRLGANLREDKGWSYGARSSFASAKDRGGWVAEAAVDGAVAEAALEEMQGEIARIGTDGITRKELRRAKDNIILSLPRAFATPQRIVQRFGTLPAYGLPADYWAHFAARVEAVTEGEVLRVARELLAEQGLAAVVVSGAAGQDS